MTQAEKIRRLQKLLSPQIVWYKKEMSARGEDSVRCFINCKFADLEEGDLMAIIALLV